MNYSYKEIISGAAVFGTAAAIFIVGYWYNTHAEGIARYIRMKAKKMFGLEKKINEPTQSKQ